MTHTDKSIPPPLRLSAVTGLGPIPSGPTGRSNWSALCAASGRSRCVSGPRLPATVSPQRLHGFVPGRLRARRKPSGRATALSVGWSPGAHRRVPGRRRTARFWRRYGQPRHPPAARRPRGGRAPDRLLEPAGAPRRHAAYRRRGGTQAARHLRVQDGIPDHPVTVVGLSSGGELALLAGAHLREDVGSTVSVIGSGAPWVRSVRT
jgi:hypothetical protein